MSRHARRPLPSDRASFGPSRTNAGAIGVATSIEQALAAFQRGDLAATERLCRSVLDVAPLRFEALYLLALVAGRSGRAADAEALLAKAVTVNPGAADAHFNRGVALGELGRHREALACYDAVLRLVPGRADAHYNRALALVALGRLEDALASYAQAIASRPDFAEAHSNLAIALVRLDRDAEALAACDRALALRPGIAGAWNNRGVALHRLGRHAEALSSFERALALNPGYAEAESNRSDALHELGRNPEALESGERAVALNPDAAEAHFHRGNALRGLNRVREAIVAYERALALRPDHASAHWNLGDCHLLVGDFERGWAEYEWRWKLPQRERGRRAFDRPLWLGDAPLQGRTILLHAEMGLGDTLQFCRYAPDVAALGARVVLEVQPPLVPLLAGLEGTTQVIARGAALPPFDCHCPLMSLPLAFRTDLARIPTRVPYLRSDPDRVAGWRARVGPSRRPRVGLAWSGSGGLRSDRRSMALADALPLLCGGVQWISLQKELEPLDAALLASHPELRHFGDELTDFAETAALVELVDLVVTVDTSVAHLAGGMRKDVWIMLPHTAHDWRWLLGRDDSPWYPTARLFRQPADGDWASVVRRVADALESRYARHS